MRENNDWAKWETSCRIKNILDRFILSDKELADAVYEFFSSGGGIEDIGSACEIISKNMIYPLASVFSSEYGKNAMNWDKLFVNIKFPGE